IRKLLFCTVPVLIVKAVHINRMGLVKFFGRCKISVIYKSIDTIAVLNVKKPPLTCGRCRISFLLPANAKGGKEQQYEQFIFHTPDTQQSKITKLFNACITFFSTGLCITRYFLHLLNA